MAENFQNFYVTKLREACDAVATTIYVDTVPAITEGTLVIEYANSTKHEIIHFTGVSGYGLTGCTRGMEGTTAQSHSAGVDVRQNLTAGMIDKIINGVITTENIADGAVTADKIDFTTLGGSFAPITYSGSKSVGSTYTLFKEQTITATGLYYVWIYASNGSSSTKTRVSAEFRINNNFIFSIGDWSATAWSGNNFCECWDSRMLWLKEDDVLALKAKSENATSNVTAQFNIQRVY